MTAAADSFVGDGLNPSPYKEALAECERRVREARREALEEAARLLLMDADHGMWPEQEVRKLCAAAIRALIETEGT